MQTSLPRDTPHRNELFAAGAVLIVLLHMLFAQVTGIVAVCCHLTGRLTSWRPTWLFVPASAGLLWTLAVGPRPAVAGLLAAPAHILGYITSNSGPPGRLLRVAGWFSGAGVWLPRQLPLALVTGAAEAVAVAAVTAQGSVRPGPWEALRRRLNLYRLRGGQLRIRDAVVLGVDIGTGAPVPLHWDDICGGVLIAGQAETDLTIPAFRLIEAAIRFRKPVIVVDLSRHAAIMTILRDVCVRYSCPVEVSREASQDELAALVRNRAAAVYPLAGEEDTARQVCEKLVWTARRLRQIGARGDGVVWLRCCADLPLDVVTQLIAECALAGLALVASTSDAEAAAQLRQRVAAEVVVAPMGELQVRVRGGHPVRAVVR
jgi:hypothetical protein